MYKRQFHIADCDIDCNGVCFGGAIVDECGNCNGDCIFIDGFIACGDSSNNDVIADCFGDCGGTAIEDECGVCDGPGLNDTFYLDPEWEENFDPTFYEFSATLSSAIIAIDDQLKTTGQLVAFVNDTIRGLDSNGASYFPPTEQYLWEVSMYSNIVSGDIVSFKYYDDENGIVIDLDETIEFSADAIIGNGFAPFEFSGILLPCDCDNNSFDDCGICGGTGTDIDEDDICDDIDDCVGAYDCAGICNGEAFLDDCGICSGGTSEHEANSDKDCFGDCFGQAIIDCNDDCGGEAFLDDCDVCSGGNSGHIADSDKDCVGDCFGEAFLDDCGICSDGNSDHEANSNKDCNGCLLYTSPSPRDRG